LSEGHIIINLYGTGNNHCYEANKCYHIWSKPLH
jgi:hypothetical protein